MLSENPENNFVITADMWVKYSYSWFMPNGPHPPNSDTDEKS